MKFLNNIAVIGFRFVRPYRLIPNVAQGVLRPAVLMASAALFISPQLLSESVAASLRDEDLTGVYELMEWRTDGVIYAPPVIDGRLTIIGGTIIAVYANHIDPAAGRSVTAYGRYTISPDHFSYWYDQTLVVTETPNGASVSHQPLWAGTRQFWVTNEQAHGLLIRTHDGKQSYTIDGLTLTFRDGGVERVWRRVIKSGLPEHPGF
jgi:hypothetical protein